MQCIHQLFSSCPPEFTKYEKAILLLGGSAFVFVVVVGSITSPHTKESIAKTALAAGAVLCGTAGALLGTRVRAILDARNRHYSLSESL